MKIYVFDPIHDLALQEASKIGQVIKWDDEKINDFSEAEAVIVRTTVMNKEKIDAMPNLKIIAKHGIGTDNINLDYAKEKGILVTNTPTANLTSVAELAVALALSCARKIPKSNNMIREGLDVLAPKSLTGIEISGKVVGLIGTGKIGQKIGNIFKKGFNMEIYAYDPYISTEMANKLGVKKFDNLIEMLMEVDIVSISVPLTPDTIDLVSTNELNKMKKTAILINTSRGKVVNEKALYCALKENKTMYAAMDVFETEPAKSDNPLFSLDNFIGTPHIGAATEEALINMGLTAVEEIKLLSESKNPKYIVNR